VLVAVADVKPWLVGPHGGCGGWQVKSPPPPVFWLFGKATTAIPFETESIVVWLVAERVGPNPT